MFEDRKIYKLNDWDGKPIFRDPMKIWRKMRQATGGKAGELIEGMKSADPTESSMATESLVKSFAFAAELQEFDPNTGNGWTEPQIIAAIDEFNRYVNGVKKNGLTTPMSSPTTKG